MIMKKKNIVILLLVIVCITVQAQIKSGINLCLRDETTGEWLIGLFNDYAIYDCECWKYAETDTTKGHFTLVKGSELLELELKGNILSINNKKHQVTKITGKFLPDYPVKDESDFIDNGYQGGKATLKGRIINAPKVTKDGIKLIVSNPLQTIINDYLHADCDSSGRFEFTIELTNTGEVSLMQRRLILTPGNTYYIFINGKTGQTYIMGRDARLSNELLAHKTPHFKILKSNFDNKTDAELLEAVNKDMQQAQNMWQQTELSSPMLSKKYRLLSRWSWKMEAAHSLVQRRFDSPSTRKNEDGQLWQWINKNIINDFARPYTLVQDLLGYTLNNYISELLQSLQHSSYASDIVEVSIDILKDNGKISMAYMDSLLTLKQLISDFKTKEKNGTPDSLLSKHPLTTMLDQMLTEGTPLTEIITSPAPSERILLKNIWKIDDFDLSEELKDLSQAIAINTLLEQNHSPLTDTLNNVMKDVVENPYYKQLIKQRSDYFAYMSNNLKRGNGCLMPNEPFAGLTNGKEIFDKIMEPYRGRVVYLDVWGTWCVPCKSNLKRLTKPIHEALRNLPVTYLYLCNRSTDEAWSSIIGEYKLTGKNSFHYNLPKDQQAAVEKYLQVNHYPTYLLFDPQGNRLPEEYRPYNLKALRETVEKLLK